MRMHELRTVKGVAATCKVLAGSGFVKLSLSLSICSSGDTRTAERALLRAATREKVAASYAFHLRKLGGCARPSPQTRLVPTSPSLGPSAPPPPPQVISQRSRVVTASTTAVSLDGSGHVMLHVQPCGESGRRPVRGVSVVCTVNGARAGRVSASGPCVKLALVVACISGGTGAELRTAERAAQRVAHQQQSAHAKRERRRLSRRLELPSQERSRRIMQLVQRRIRSATVINSAARARIARALCSRMRTQKLAAEAKVINCFLDAIAPHPASFSSILAHRRTEASSSPWTLLATSWPAAWREHLEETNRSRARLYASWSKRPVVFGDGHPREVFRLREEPGRALRPGVPLIGRETGFEWDWD